MESPAQLDRLMAAAWPPAVSTTDQEWISRYTKGVTRRANSVLVQGEPDDLARSVEMAERFYEEPKVDPAFLVSDASAPASVSVFLEQRGYRASATTMMLTAFSNEVAELGATSTQWSVNIAEEPNDEWFDIYWSVVSGHRSPIDKLILRDVLLRPNLPTGFISIGNEEGPVSVGQIVIRDGWACTQCLATSHAGRRQGAASQVARRLAAEATQRGAPRMLAAVMTTNKASLALFESLSFRREHQYRYYVP